MSMADSNITTFVAAERARPPKRFCFQYTYINTNQLNSFKKFVKKPLHLPSCYTYLVMYIGNFPCPATRKFTCTYIGLGSHTI